MRICFLNHDLKDSSGAGRFGLNLIGRLLATDSKMKVLVLTSLGCAHPLEKAILSPNIFKLILALPRISRLFKNFDIIHALDGWPYGVLAAICAIGATKPLIITAIGTGAVQPLYDWRRPFIVWAYRRASRLVAISKNTRDEILQVLPGLNIEVINHGVDAEEFSGDADAELSPEEISVIARLEPYLLSIGGWKRRKGFEYSFPAFAEIRKRFPNLSYVVCGIRPKPQLTDPLGITDSVFYFKGVSWPFLRSLYRHAELFMLLPVDDHKDMEGFGLVFLEAAAAGLPVIGTIHSSAEDAISGGRNGFLVPPCDSASAAHAAVKILADADLKIAFHKGSLDFAKSMSWPAVADRYRRIYKELLIRSH